MGPIVLKHLLAVSVLVIVTVVPTASCSSIDVDDVVEKAKDAVETAGEAIGEVVEDAIGDDPATSSSPQGGGAQTVERPPRPTGTVSIGPATLVSSQVVEPSGGSVKVEKPGDPLDGLELTIPAGSYPEAKQFNISHSPVTAHSFGEYFNPATPLITVENSGQYSSELMTMRIPLDVPPDHFAMAFYYDDEKGTLEGIPFSSIESDSITIVTRHFCTLLVSIINNTVLDDLLKADIDSHYRPGIDDWQFENPSTWATPNGACAGHALSSMWYFCVQPDGVDRTLHGRYDRNGVQPATPGLWQDDSRGIRLVTRVQGEIYWGASAMTTMEALAGAVGDEFTFKAFGYAIQLTGEPQEVGIYSSSGGGHDMVCYRVHKGNLYIADPNYVGDANRRIEYANGAFKPYNSGANPAEIAAGRGKAYENIQYAAKTATHDWKKIAQRWDEFKAGTIGWDIYPAYQILIGETKDKPVPLTDGFKSAQKKVLLGGTGLCPIGIAVYRDGAPLAADADGRYELVEGENLLGIGIYGDKNYDPQNRKWQYIDFVYVNVTYGDQECRGWVLDSVTTRDVYLASEDANRQNLQFTSSEHGTFSGSGRYVMIDPVGGSTGDEVLVASTCSGTWTPPPVCIRPDEVVSLDMRLTSNAVYDQAVDYYKLNNHLVISDARGLWTHLNHEVSPSNASADDSTTANIVLWEGSSSSDPVEIVVRCGSQEGSIKYVYTYVWRG